MFKTKNLFILLTLALFISNCSSDSDGSSSNNSNSNSNGNSSSNGGSDNSNPTAGQELYSKVIKKTGQTLSYAADGQVTTDGSIKDDGYYQKGSSVDYQRDSTKEIVKDRVDSLVWLDNSSVKSSELSYNDAKNYCENLTFANINSWRVPTIKELMAIADHTKRAPAIDTAFLNTAYGTDDIGYWSATSRGFGWQMWINFFSGNDHWYETTSNRHYIRCVSGYSSQWASANFTRSAAGTVVDNNSNLEWQDSYSSSIKKTSWKDAIDYCENLELNGKNDWRLPNINELYSITDHYRGSPAIDPIFQNSYEGLYWSSTSYSGSSSYAWLVNFEYGSNSYQSKSKTYAVRCVR